jgi:hypothetical protein
LGSQGSWSGTCEVADILFSRWFDIDASLAEGLRDAMLVRFMEAQTQTKSEPVGSSNMLQVETSNAGEDYQPAEDIGFVAGF